MSKRIGDMTQVELRALVMKVFGDIVESEYLRTRDALSHLSRAIDNLRIELQVTGMAPSLLEKASRVAESAVSLREQIERQAKAARQ